MEEQNFGVLFDTIELHDENHLDVILHTMDKNTAIYILTQAVTHSFRKGAFTLGESEVISKSLRILHREEPKVEEEKKD